MRISIVCSSREHPVFPRLQQWAEARQGPHQVELVNEASQLDGGDLLFLISCSEIITHATRDRFKHSLVVHASPLPEGRGWSPHIWQILEGAHTIPVTLLEAEDRVDTGAIWSQRTIHLEGHELYDEINSKLFDVLLELLDFAVDNAASVQPQPQSDVPPTYYRKRTAQDSRLDPGKTLAEQFDLLRVADAARFPCFFEYRGQRYVISIKKDEKP